MVMAVTKNVYELAFHFHVVWYMEFTEIWKSDKKYDISMF